MGFERFCCETTKSQVTQSTWCILSEEIYTRVEYRIPVINNFMVENFGKEFPNIYSRMLGEPVKGRHQRKRLTTHMWSTLLFRAPAARSLFMMAPVHSMI